MLAFLTTMMEKNTWKYMVKEIPSEISVMIMLMREDLRIKYRNFTKATKVLAEDFPNFKSRF